MVYRRPCVASRFASDNEECYVPLAHREGGTDKGGLFAGSERKTRFRRMDALAALKPLLEDRSVPQGESKPEVDFAGLGTRGLRSRPATTRC